MLNFDGKLADNPIFQQLVITLVVTTGSWYALLKEIDYTTANNVIEIAVLKENMHKLDDELTELAKDIAYLEGKFQLKQTAFNDTNLVKVTEETTLPDTALQKNYINTISTE